MSDKPTGGPAFPQAVTDYRRYEGREHDGFCADGDPREGMTIRDYFAAQALQGLIAAESNALLATLRRQTARDRQMEYTELLTMECYGIADAMIAEREK